MTKINAIVRNEEGSVMLIALLIMAILTILGISAIDTSNLEIQIAANEMTYKDNFYKAEAAVSAGAQTLEDMTSGQLGDITNFDWINMPSAGITADNLQLGTNAWEDGNNIASWANDLSTYNNPRTVDLAGAQFTVIEQTGFIDLAAPSNLHEYQIFGVYNSTGRDRGQVVIEVGYKRRF